MDAVGAGNDNVHRTHVAATLMDDVIASTQGRIHIAAVESLYEIEYFLSTDTPLSFYAYATNFTIEYKHIILVEERHVVFDCDTFVFERTARMRDE